MNYNIKDVKDKVLVDTRDNGKDVGWSYKKEKTLLLSESYHRLKLDKKSLRVKECGTYLEFRRYHDSSLKLNQANFCKVRLCPLCSWRRSLKIFGQVSKIMDYVTQNNDLEFIFLTLTMKNCDGSELKETIDSLMLAFSKLVKYKKYKNSIIGHFRALEVTHKLIDDTYHPHFHCILVVNKSYFTNNRRYLSQDDWTSLWKKALQIDYTPIVHVTKVRNTKDNHISKVVAEVAKYTVKSDDYLINLNINSDIKKISQQITDKAVEVLDEALASRRLIAFGGILKEIQKLLNLDDVEDGDLVNTDNEEIREDLGYVIETYCWNVGYRNYLRVGE